MEIRQLRTFHTVATLMSFHGAAKALGYAQSTVSAQIQNLEDDLGAKVFERVGRTFNLTPEGERLMEYAKRMVDLEVEAREKVLKSTDSDTTIHISADEYFCTIYICEILRILDGISEDLQVQFKPLLHDNMSKQLKSGDVDLAVIIGRDTGGDAGEEDLEYEQLGSESLVLVGRRKLQLSGQLLVTDDDLADQRLLVLTSEPRCAAIVEGMLQGRSVPFARRVELGSLATLLRLVSAGQGVAFLPRVLAMQEQKAGRLSILEWEGGSAEVALHMVRRRNAPASPIVENFMEAVRAAVTAVGNK